MGKDQSVPLTATFTVASEAQVGDVSTIVVTATSLLDGTQNSALSRLVIVSGVSLRLPNYQKKIPNITMIH